MSDSFDTILTNAKAYATSLLSGATLQIDEAMSIAGNLGAGAENQALPTINIVPPEPMALGDVPTYSGATWNAPVLSATSPTLYNMPSLIFPDIEVYSPETITFTNPVRPTGEPDRAIIGPAPDLGDELEIPTAPDLLSAIAAIPAPDITAITIPDAPDYVPPTFDAQRPTVSVSAPTDLDVTFRTQFDTAGQIMRAVNQDALEAFLDRDFPEFRTATATLEAKLETFIAGGTGLSTTVQDAIFTRLQDKISTDSQRARDAAMKEFAQAGFTMFSPYLAARLQTLDQEGRDNQARGAIEIAIKNAELEQQNIQFALGKSIEFRQIALAAAMQYYGGLVQTNGQAIEYAKGIVDAIVQTYDIAAKIADLQARIYEADARVYESRLKGAMAVIEAYKARVDGLRAQADVDTALVNQYRARIEAVQAEATIYRAVIDGVTAQAQIKRLTVEVYQARTASYVAQVNAQSAQWQAYEAATKGEVARIEAIKAQEQIFLQQAQTQVEIVKAKVAQIGAYASANQSAVQVYNAEINAFTALVDGQAKAIQAEVAGFDATLKAFVANAHAQSEHDRAEIAAFTAGHTAMVETANLFHQNLIEKAKILQTRLEAVAKITTAGAQLYGESSKAALSGFTMVAGDQTNRTA